MKVSLERAANLAVLATCAAVLGTMGYRSLAPRNVKPFAVGQLVKNTPSLAFNAAPRTLVLITASTCHFCVESLPFYRRLVETAHKSGTRVVAVTTEPTDKNRTFLLENGISVEATLAEKDADIHILGTPTLIVVQRDGRVLNSSFGKLRTAVEEEKALRAVAGT
jgi:hypothetical protein